MDIKILDNTIKVIESLGDTNILLGVEKKLCDIAEIVI